jgi:hypothetical protein
MIIMEFRISIHPLKKIMEDCAFLLPGVPNGEVSCGTSDTGRI